MSTDSVLVCAAISARPASSLDARSTTAEENSWSTSSGSITCAMKSSCGSATGNATQHDGVDERKNRAARPDAERQREHGDGGKTAPSGEQAGSETEIVQEMFYGPQGAHVATGLLHVINASHLASSSPPCIRRVVSTRYRERPASVRNEIAAPRRAPARRSGAAGPTAAPSARDDAGVGASGQTVSRSVVTADDRRRHCVVSRSSWRRPARVSE